MNDFIQRKEFSSIYNDLENGLDKGVTNIKDGYDQFIYGAKDGLRRLIDRQPVRFGKPRYLKIKQTNTTTRPYHEDYGKRYSSLIEKRTSPDGKVQRDRIYYNTLDDLPSGNAKVSESPLDAKHYPSYAELGPEHNDIELVDGYGPADSMKKGLKTVKTGVKNIFNQLQNSLDDSINTVISEKNLYDRRKRLNQALDGYNLDLDFSDKPGNRFLVPTELGYKGSEPTIQPNEFRYKNEEPARYSGSDLTFTGNEDNAFDYYSKLGFLSPYKFPDKNINFLAEKGVIPKDKDKYRVRGGLVDLDKVTAHQLGGDPLGEAIAKRLSETTYHNRYNLLRPNDKLNVDNITKQLGYHPHYSTISLPEPMYWGWKDKNALKGKNVLYADSKFPNSVFNGMLVNDKNKKTPLVYDTYAKLPNVQMPTDFYLTDTNALDITGRLHEGSLSNPLLMESLKGKMPITDLQLADQFKNKQTGPGSFSTRRFLPFMKSDEGYGMEDLTLNHRPAAAPGVFLVNNISEQPAESAIFNDMLKANLKDAGRSNLKYRFLGNGKGTADHELMHTLNSSHSRALDYELSKLNKAREAGAFLYKKTPKSLNKQVGSLLGSDAVTSFIKNKENTIKRLSDMAGRNGAGFFVPESYFSMGQGEQTRGLAMNKRLVLNHLKEVLPSQMEARGLLKGMSDSEKLDAIADKAVSMANNPLIFDKVMGDIIGRRRVPEKILGNLDPLEVHRAVEGYKKSTDDLELFKKFDKPTKNFLRKNLFHFAPLREKYLEQMLPLIGKNDSNTGSVLA